MGPEVPPVVPERLDTSKRLFLFEVFWLEVSTALIVWNFVLFY
jgi:hypothetical protein